MADNRTIAEQVQSLVEGAESWSKSAVEGARMVATRAYPNTENGHANCRTYFGYLRQKYEGLQMHAARLLVRNDLDEDQRKKVEKARDDMNQARARSAVQVGPHGAAGPSTTIGDCRAHPHPHAGSWHRHTCIGCVFERRLRKLFTQAFG